MFCDQCGQRVAQGVTVCPHCRAVLDGGTPTRDHRRPAASIPVTSEGIDRLRARYPRAGHVAQGPGGRTWLNATFSRNRRGTIAGIVAAWFQVPFIVLMAGIGAVFGGLAGTVNGTVAGLGVTKRIDALLTWVFPLPVKVKDLLPTAGVQIGGIIGGILGAVNGALKRRSARC